MKHKGKYFIGFIITLCAAGIAFLLALYYGIQTDDTPSEFLYIFLMAILIVISAVLYWLYRKDLKKQEALATLQNALQEAQAYLAAQKKEFEAWLNENNFICSKQVDNLMIDFQNKRWCQFKTKTIFAFSDVISVEIHKTKKETHASEGTNNRLYNSSQRNFSSTTQDASTYDVHIQTNRIEKPLVVFPCETSFELANELCATARLLINYHDE